MGSSAWPPNSLRIAESSLFANTASSRESKRANREAASTGTGGSKHPDLAQEFNAEPHVRGVCSMARTSNPDSANSQFFICFDDARFLDNQYTVWGEVIEGMDLIDALPKGEPPRTPGRIVSARVS